MERIPDFTSLGKVWDQLGLPGLFSTCSHRIHVWYIYLYRYHINQLNDGKNTSPNESYWLELSLSKNQRKNRGANGLRGAMQACTRVRGLGDSTVVWGLGGWNSPGAVGSYQANRTVTWNPKIDIHQRIQVPNLEVLYLIRLF